MQPAMEIYPYLKLAHITTALISIALFALRVVLSLERPYRSLPAVLRITPHVNDSLLLGSAIGLVMLSQQYPLTTAWLNAKIIALLLYIGLGSYALKKARGFRARLAWGSAAMITALYIVAVARSQSAWVFF